ncbi:MAG: V-type ATPase subunit [Candidatus Omnitrophica bacterium]|nr:V-type ATPase subunit [Candidatus Omnitrophota bacterium]
MNHNYAYAVGKIRALEKRLLSKSFLEKIAESGSLEAITQDIRETAYSGEFAEERELFSLLRNERKATYNLIEKLLEEPSLSPLLRLRYDIHNLKLLLKKEIDRSVSADFSPLGAISPSLLEKAIQNKAFLQIPSYFREIAKKSIALFQAEGIKQLEQFLDKEMWKLTLDESKEIKNIFLEEFFKLQIDFLNIRNFFSLGEKENFDVIFIVGGRLEKKIFKKERAAIEKKIFFFYSGLELDETSSLEKSSDDLLINYIKKAKIYSFGTEPLIAYLFAKEGELKNIKLILLGKLNNIGVSVIKENLRETYV